MTTASKITLCRIVLIPIFFVLMLIRFPGHDWAALGVFIVASLTDMLDGHVARKYGQTSNFGKFLDPLADKLLVIAALLVFVANGQMACWAAMVIITRELAVTGLRLVAMESGLVIAAGRSGKVKTFVSMVGICIMIPEWKNTAIIGAFDLNWLIVILMLVTTVYSGVEYFVKNIKLLKQEK